VRNTAELRFDQHLRICYTMLSLAAPMNILQKRMRNMASFVREESFGSVRIFWLEQDELIQALRKTAERVGSFSLHREGIGQSHCGGRGKKRCPSLYALTRLNLKNIKIIKIGNSNLWKR